MTEKQIIDWLTNWVNYIIDTSIIRNNCTTVEEISSIRDDIYDALGENLDEINYNNSQNSLERRGECNGKRAIQCIAYSAGIAGCLAAYSLGPITGVAATACVSALGGHALACFNDCW